MHAIGALALTELIMIHQVLVSVSNAQYCWNVPLLRFFWTSSKIMAVVFQRLFHACTTNMAWVEGFFEVCYLKLIFWGLLLSLHGFLHTTGLSLTAGREGCWAMCYLGLVGVIQENVQAVVQPTSQIQETAIILGGFYTLTLTLTLTLGGFYCCLTSVSSIKMR